MLASKHLEDFQLVGKDKFVYYDEKSELYWLMDIKDAALFEDIFKQYDDVQIAISAWSLVTAGIAFEEIKKFRGLGLEKRIDINGDTYIIDYAVCQKNPDDVGCEDLTLLI